MKLLIINYMALPLPPVKDGAVEHLIDMYLQENEEKFHHDITAYSIYNEEAEDMGKQYKYCDFKYIKIDTILDKANRGIRHLINRYTKLYIGNMYIKKVIKSMMEENKKSKYDAIIVENAPEFGLMLSKITSTKLILHLHNDFLNNYTRYSKEILDCYSRVFVLSDFIGNKVKGIYQSDKIKTLYNGIDLMRFNKLLYDEKTIRINHEIGVEDTVIIFSGRLVPDKGVKELLQAFSNLDNNKQLKLVIIGSARYGETVYDDYYNDLIRIAEPIKDKVIFLGYVPYKDTPPIYSIADIGVVPSMCEEGFNLTVIELMANGVPLIISDRGAMKEIINSECGMIVNSKCDFVKEMEEKLNYLIRNKEVRLKMGIASAKRSKRFDKMTYCNTFEALLKDAIL